MKHTKRRAETFSSYDYKRMENHLNAMARQGWFLKSIGTFFWTYEKGEPADLIYRIVFLPEGFDYLPAPDNHLNNPYQLFLEHGWHLVLTWNQMQIFSSSASNPDRDFCLQSQENTLFHLHNFMKKKVCIPYLIIAVLWGISMSMRIYEINRWPERYFAPHSILLIIFIGFVGVYLLIFLTCYFIWHKKAEEAVKNGDPVPLPVNFSLLNKGLSFITAFFLIAYYCLMTIPHKTIVIIFSLFMGFSVIAIAGFLKKHLKKAGASGTLASVISFVFLFLFYMICFYLFTRWFISL